MSVSLEGPLAVKKTETDIKVYKILEEFNGRFVGPYNRCYTYRKGVNVPDFPEKYCYYTGEGWLSAYTDKEQAEGWKKIWEKDFPEKTYSIHEMIIPKGTEYIEHMTSKEFKTKKLIFNP